MLCRWFLRPTLFLCASVAHTLAVRSKLPATPRKRMSPAKVATTLAVTATGAVFVNYKMAHAAAAAPKDALMAQGLFYSFLALCGNTAAALLRKQVSRGSSVRPAEQVGLATAIQGVAALAYCSSQGLLGTAVAGTFLLPAVGSSVLNALTKTLETKAYAITDVSLCAPFLAFDPVMQFLLPALLAPLACAAAGVGCADAKTSFPPYHPLAVWNNSNPWLISAQSSAAMRAVRGVRAPPSTCRPLTRLSAVAPAARDPFKRESTPSKYSCGTATMTKSAPSATRRSAVATRFAGRAHAPT